MTATPLNSSAPGIIDAEFKPVPDVSDTETSGTSDDVSDASGTALAVVVPPVGGALDAWVEPQPIRRTDESLIEGWLASKRSERTQRAYRDDIEAFRAWTGWRPLATITDHMISVHIDTMTTKDGKPVSDRTRERRLTAIRSLLKYGVEKKHLALNEAASIKRKAPEDKLAQRILTKRAVRALVRAAAPGRDRGLLALLYVAGLRVSEASGLRWEHLLPAEAPKPDNAASLTVYGKGGKTRQIVLPESIVHDLEDLRSKMAQTSAALVGDDQPIFRSRKTAGRSAGHLHPATIHRIIKDALDTARAQAAGSKDPGSDRLLAELKAGTSAHWFRHAHAKHALKAGADLLLVRDTLGHSSIATTNRYLKGEEERSSAGYVSGILDDL